MLSLQSGPLLQFNAQGTSEKFQRMGKDWSYQATVAGTGAVSAGVSIDVSNDGVGWVELGTLAPSGTDLATDTLTTATPWVYHRARVTAISGTGAVCTISAVGA
jgi:hypothetical protein